MSEIFLPFDFSSQKNCLQGDAPAVCYTSTHQRGILQVFLAKFGGEFIPNDLLPREMHPAVCPETQRWSEAKDGDGGSGEGGRRQTRRGSQRQSKNQVSPQDEVEGDNSGLSSKRDSLVQTTNQTSPTADACVLSSRRGSHRQSRNQVSPGGEEEEFECSLNLKGGSSRQSRVFSPESEYLTKEWAGRGEEQVRFEREKVPKRESRSVQGGGLCENAEEIGKSSSWKNGYCEEEEVARRMCNQSDPLLMIKSPQRPPHPSLPAEVT